MKLLTAHSFAKTKIPSIAYNEISIGIATIRKWSWKRFNYITEDVPIYYDSYWTDMNTGTRFSREESDRINVMRTAQEVRVALGKHESIIPKH